LIIDTLFATFAAYSTKIPLEFSQFQTIRLLTE
jgi:hypothetical protein